MHHYQRAIKFNKIYNVYIMQKFALFSKNGCNYLCFIQKHTHTYSILFQFIHVVIPLMNFQSTSSYKILFYIKHTYDHFISIDMCTFDTCTVQTHAATNSTKTKMHFSLQQQQNYHRCSPATHSFCFCLLLFRPFYKMFGGVTWRESGTFLNFLF